MPATPIDYASAKASVINAALSWYTTLGSDDAAKDLNGAVRSLIESALASAESKTTTPTPTRNRYPMTQERARTIIDLHRSGGVDLVTAELGVVKRHAWRLLGEARKMMQVPAPVPKYPSHPQGSS